jgi:hypothetical protein
MRKFKSLATLVILGIWVSLANSQYLVVLKNGRQLTVQSYREEGSTVKIQGLGGELGIPKEQIQSISKSGQSDRPGLNLNNLESASRPVPAASKPPASAPLSRPSEVTGSVDENAAVNADDEKEYRRRLAEVTQKLESARKRYFDATQGGGTPANVSREGLRAWTMDFASRIHDSQKVPGGGGPPGTPPAKPYAPRYTPMEKELSDLRIEIDRLEKERNDLIQEMKSKNIDA